LKREAVSVNDEEWEKAVPDLIKSDSLRRTRGYKLAMFVAGLG